MSVSSSVLISHGFKPLIDRVGYPFSLHYKPVSCPVLRFFIPPSHIPTGASLSSLLCFKRSSYCSSRLSSFQVHAAFAFSRASHSPTHTGIQSLHWVEVLCTHLHRLAVFNCSVFVCSVFPVPCSQVHRKYTPNHGIIQ